jgi:radical SAM superfamily enzyme YgiQ (UPF0313 family)
LNEAGVTRAYLGVESGDDKILRDACKGVDVEEMERAGKSLVEAGIELCAIILIGLEGKDRSAENSLGTASIVNRIKPAQLAAMTYTPVPGTRMFTQIQKGEFRPLGTKGALQETRALVANFDVDAWGYRCLRPELALEALPTSPDFQYLLEHPGSEGIERADRARGSRGIRRRGLRALLREDEELHGSIWWLPTRA